MGVHCTLATSYNVLSSLMKTVCTSTDDISLIPLLVDDGRDSEEWFCPAFW